MPTNGQVLCRTGTADWTNVSVDAASLKLDSSVEIAQRGTEAGWHNAYQWIDFYYGWMTAYNQHGNTSWLSRDGNALRLAPGTYQIHLSFRGDFGVGPTQYWMQPYQPNVGDWTTWSRIGVSRARNNSVQTCTAWIEVPTGGAKIVAQRCNDALNGVNESGRSINWRAVVMKYTATGQSRPDEVLARTNPTDQWTNQGASQALGIASAAPLMHNRVFTTSGYSIFTRPENSIRYGDIGDTSWLGISSTGSVSIDEPGLYEIRESYNPHALKRMVWNNNGSPHNSSSPTRMGSPTMWSDQDRWTGNVCVINYDGSNPYWTLWSGDADHASNNVAFDCLNTSYVRLGPAI